MISEFSVKPKAQNKNAYYLMYAFLLGALVTVVIYFLMTNFKGLVGLLTVAFITAAVFIYTKYIAAQYIYDITFNSSADAVFVVRQKTGKKDTTLACIYLSGIISVQILDKAERNSHTTPYGVCKYVYTPSISPDTVCLITYHSRYEKSEIYIEANREFASLLETYAKEAREAEEKENEEY